MSDRTLYAEIAALRVKLAEKDATIREFKKQQRQAWHPFYRVAGLQPIEARFVGALVKHRVRTHEQMYFALYGDRHYDNPPQDRGMRECLPSKIRRKLRPFGIDIISHWGEGFEMTPENADKLRALANLPVVSAPGLQATIEEMAA